MLTRKNIGAIATLLAIFAATSVAQTIVPTSTTGGALRSGKMVSTAHANGETTSDTLAVYHNYQGAGPGEITVEGIEVAQSIQDLANSVPLIANKATIVRVYLSYESDHAITVRGQLSVRRVADGSVITVDSFGSLNLETSLNGQTQQKRGRLDQSLNFALPPNAIAAGAVKIFLSKVSEVASGSSLNCSNCSTVATGELKFVTVPPLRIKLIGLRYKLRDPNTGITVDYAPTERNFNMIESWLRRAYPISQLISSRAIIPVPDFIPIDQLTCDNANALIAATRANDIRGGSTDPRTHYYGVVPDAGGRNFMRGCATVPDVPDPSAIGSGPTGVPSSEGFDWDLDGDYGDWYTGHELAHTFGRKHPGKCTESKDDLDPQATKFIGDPNNSLVGYDLGDASPTAALPQAVLPGQVWTDIMTYCDHQWISSYTYQHIMERLVAENSPSQLSGPVSAEMISSSGGRQALAPAKSLSNNAETAASNVSQNSSSATSTVSNQSAHTESGTGDQVNPTNTTQQDEQYITGRFLSIIGTVNLTKRTGVLLPPFPVAKADAKTAGREAGLTYPQAKIQLKNRDGNVIGEYAFPVRLSTDKDTSREDQTGLVNGVIPILPNISTIDFILIGDSNGNATEQTLLKTFNVNDSKPKVNNLVVKPQTGGVGPNATQFPLDISWDVSDKGGDKVLYFVEISKDGGNTWLTAAPYADMKSIKLDPKLGPDDKDIKEIKVRVTAIDGFNSSEKIKTVKIH